jgi:hypothetical protein
MGLIPMNKKQKKQQVDESILFKALAMEWMEDRKAVIKEGTYLRDLSVFEKDLFPALGICLLIKLKGKMFLLVLNKLKHVVHKRWLNALYL